MTPDTDPGLLGTRPDRAAFAQGPAADLGTYGAAPSVFLVSAAQPASSLAAPPGAADTSAAADPAETALVVADPQAWTSGSDLPLGPLNGGGLLTGGGPSAILSPQSGGTLADPASGSAPIPALLAFTQASPLDLALIQQHADGLKQAISSLDLSAAGDAAAGAAGSILAVQQQAADMIGSMNALLENALAGPGAALPAIDLIAPQLTASLADSLTAATGLVAQVAADGGTLVAGVAGAALGDLDSAVTPLDDTVSTVLSQTVSAVAPVTAALEPVTFALEPAEDLLASLTGSDPAGGLATLTGLVSVADAFQLHDDAAADLHLSETLGVLGTLDLLAPPEPGDGLLGVLDTSHGLGDLAGHHDLDLGFG